MTRKQKKKLKTITSKKEILKLKKELDYLKIRIDEQNSLINKEKYLNIIKKFVSVCNFAAPFIITSGLTIGGIKFFGGGFPVVIDDISKSKKYTLEAEFNGDIEVKEEYIKTKVFFEDLDTNKLRVYFPYILEDNGEYKRVIRDYKMLDVFEVYKSLLNNDINSLLFNVVEYNEIVEKTKVINEEDNKYYVEAFINYIDYSNTLMVPETEFKNLLITLTSLILSFSISGYIMKCRDFRLKPSLRKVDSEYENLLQYKESLELRYAECENKILSLKKGGDTNDR